GSRPGRPWVFAGPAPRRFLGLPGTPVSARLCARLFLKPLIAGLLGLSPDEPLSKAKLETPLPANDHRQDYLRARLSRQPDGTMTAAPFARQDSSMQRTLYEAQGLIVRAPHAAPAAPGEMVDILEIDF